MKKLLCAFLASILIVSTFTVYAGKEKIYSDVKGGEYYAAAVEVLSELDILNGYEDGSFKAERSVTRAEMAAVIVRMLGMDEEADDNKGKTDFDDVDKDHWASGYINTAVEEGIINGDGDGKFRPEDEVKHEEAIKMVVCAQGLGDGVKSSGTNWAKPYLEIAEENGISDGLETEKGEAATRGDVAVMVYNGLSTGITAPKLSLRSGTHTGTQYVTITTDTANAQIYYTLDGTKPTTSSNLYTDPVKVSKTSTLRAITVKYGLFASDVTEGKYVISQVLPGGGGTTKYAVTFDLNYEGAVAADAPAKQNVKKGKTATEPEEPSREGYEFLGWFTDKNGADEFDFTTAINKKTTLYASWKQTGDAPVETFTVTFDLNYEGATGAPEEQTVESGEYATIPETPIRNGYSFVGWYTNVDFTESFDFAKTAITANITIYARWVNISDAADTDNDGLTDSLEEFYGTDKNNADTDEDGLNDFFELAYSMTSPLKPDSDDNGVNDANEDFDNDTLTNLKEMLNNGNPYMEDTDLDTILDKDELTAATKLDDYDSDADGLADNLEPQFNMDPLLEDTLGDGIKDGNRVFSVVSTSDDVEDDDTVVPSVEIALKGAQVDSLVVSKVDGNDIFLSEDVPGYIGNAYDFKVNGDFDTARITFELDAKLLQDPGFVPAIYYFNEDDQVLEELPNQTLNGNKISAEVEHFSKYIVLAKNRYEQEICQFEIIAPSDEDMQKKIDMALVLDESGSIYDSDYIRIKNVSSDLTSRLGDTDRVAIFTFDETVRPRTQNFVDKTTAMQVISEMDQNYGLTAIYDGIYTANNLFINNSGTDTKRIMIVLTDGLDNSSHYSSSSVAQTAVNNKIIIYTIGVGNVNSGVLTQLAEATGGKYYSASNFSELYGIFEDIEENVDLHKDTDDDGISDYHEKKIISGEMHLGTGAKLVLGDDISFKSLSYNDPNNPDSDGDGLEDGEELIIKSQFVANKEIYYCKLVSNPCVADSDKDGYNDKEEISNGTEPLKWDVSHRDLAICADLSYDKLSSGSNMAIDFGKELHGWSVLDSWSKITGMQATAFIKDNNVILAYRGTTSLIDWINNGTTWIQGASIQVPSAKTVAKDTLSKHSDKNFYIIGHSLGGHLAYNAGAEAIKKNSNAVKEIVTFNGLGLAAGWFDLGDEITLLKNSYKITDYVVDGDPVYPIPLTIHCGKKELIGQNYFNGTFPAHSMINFLNVLEPKGR